MKTKITTASLLIVGLAFTLKSDAQFVNNGSDIFVESNANIYVEGNFISQADGLISNNGILQVGGDWSNNSVNTPILASSGTVDLVGITQTIGGNPTDFNNLILSGTGTKSLDVLTFVGRGGAGTLDLVDATLTLSGDTLAILNTSSNAITRTSGTIISETSVNESPVHWDIGIATGTYIFPFGTVGSTYIPVTVNVTTAGTGNGILSVSTYPTGVNNQPYPTGVTNLDLNNQNDSLMVVDRFWNIEMLDYMTNPISDIDLGYDNVNDIKMNNTITEDSLVVIKWDSNANTWNALVSNINTSSSLVSTSSVSDYGFFSLWSDDRITSVDELSINLVNGIGFYPNPSNNGNVNLDLSAEIHGLVTVQFFNSVGKLIYTQNKNINTGTNSLNFNLAGLQTGLYHVVINNENKQLSTKLLLTK